MIDGGTSGVRKDFAPYQKISDCYRANSDTRINTSFGRAKGTDCPYAISKCWQFTKLHGHYLILDCIICSVILKMGSLHSAGT